MTVSPLDRARPGGPGGCGWPKPPVSQNFLHSRRGSPRWLMVQPTALPCSRPDPACVQPGRSPPGPLGPPGSRAPSGRRLPQGTGQLLLPPWHRPLHLRVRAQVPRLPGIKLQPHSPPRGRARLFRCCLPVSREHVARCAVSPQTGAPSPPRPPVPPETTCPRTGDRALDPQHPPRGFQRTFPRGLRHRTPTRRARVPAPASRSMKARDTPDTCWGLSASSAMPPPPCPGTQAGHC